MTKHHSRHTDCLLPPGCEHRCEDIPKELPNYFTGRLLTARDLRDEQHYLLSRLRLRHRLFHGWGVVCGLDVRPHPSADCPNHVVVEPGIAIDCCGNDIFVCDSVVLKLPPLPEPDPCPPDDDPDYGKKDPPFGARPRPDPDDPAQTRPERQAAPEQRGRYDDIRDPDKTPPEDDKDPDRTGYDARPTPEPEPEPERGPYIICLSYRRKGIEPRPVLDDGCGCDATRTAPTRQRDTFGLSLVPQAELDPDCWPSGADDGCKLGCQEEDAADCFAPDCPCKDCVPLARLTLHDGAVKIDMLGRPEIMTTLRRHTRIAGVNWPHGGKIAPEVLRDDMGGAFVVHFTAPVAKAVPGKGNGISRFTFEVTFAGVQNDVEFLPYEVEPYLSDDGCSAHYPIAKALLDRIDRLSNRDIRIRLRGDFILDTHGRPIDADFLRGLTPSGNGSPGGTFESWVETDR